MKMSHNVLALLTALFVLPALASSDAEWEKQRQEIVNRKRQIIYNTDGCDISHFPADKSPTPENFKNLRLCYTKDTATDVISYCVHGSFGMVTYNSKVADIFVDSAPPDPKAHWRYRNSRNPMRDFLKQGTDALQITIDYARSVDKEVWASFRMNDRHDQIYNLGESFLASKFKVRHPDMLMGTRENRPKYAAWNQVDYGQKVVRDHMIAMLKEVCENYDIDAIELDFMRHSALLKSVAYGKKPSRSEMNALNDFMRQIRANAEAAGKKRGKPIMIALRLPDSLEFCNALGIDLENWMKNRYFDIYIGSAYYQLKHWKDSVELSQKYGIKFIASLDESRIGYHEPNVKCLPGRLNGNMPYMNARILAAMASGCDGVYHFNTEYESLTRITKTPVTELEFTDKLYFVSERGGRMGYIPNQNVKNGNSYYKMVRIDPSFNPPVLNPGKPFAFQLMIGDDLQSDAAKKCNPYITMDVLAETSDGIPPEFYINGVKAKFLKRDGEVFSFEISADVLFKGINQFSAVAAKRTLLHDVCVKITYKKKYAAVMEKFADLPIQENASFRVNDGQIFISGKLINQYTDSKVINIGSDSAVLNHNTNFSKFNYVHVGCNDVEFMNNPPEIFAAEWESRVLENGKNGESALSFVFAPKRPGNGVWENAVTFTKENCLVNGTPIPGNFAEFHRFRFVLDTTNGASALWLDNELIYCGDTNNGEKRKEPFIMFGDGSGRISGSAEIKYIINGSLERR